ncbi:aldehyde reductase [Phyllobacterium sp. YR531]|uniref:SDR family oxidoreductase n=1 Tax=Phyllobacterium sp. YR531 TaxID=1144343 RepID=UPI00026F8736|nr:aldehyde reductase [Phyllobacterium sp. YR531]EJN02129.1 nucleoside-diphosphate-sugar epimerase [Phyllobacterium sp. YR531]
MPEIVLVTGGTGFVAQWCIIELLRCGYHVRTTLRDLKRSEEVCGAIEPFVENSSKLSFVVADLLDDRGWNEAMEGCTYVMHVASPLSGGNPADRNSYVKPARDGTLRVLRAAVNAGVKRVVMTSAAATARPPLTSKRISDETVWADPDDPQFDAYRVSKILAERAAWEFMNEHRRTTEFTTVLPGAVFGPVLAPHNLGSVKIIQDLLNGFPRVIPKLGFWIVDVRDLADIHVRAMISKDAAGERFIAAGNFMWMDEIAGVLRSGLGIKGKKVPTRQLPEFLVKILLPFLPNLKPLAPLIGHKFLLTTQKVRKVLGFNPRPHRDTIIDCANSLNGSSASAS